MTIILDREALAVLLERSPHTIRQRCTPIGYDWRGRPIYDAKACAEKLADTPTRKRKWQAA